MTAASERLANRSIRPLKPTTAVPAQAPKLTLKPWLVVDRLAIEQQTLDRGAARRRNGRDGHRQRLEGHGLP